MALIDDIRKQYPDATSGKTDLDVASDFAQANGWSLAQTAYKMGVELPNEPGFATTVKRSGAQFLGGVGEIYGDVTGSRNNALSQWANEVAATNPSGINSLQDIADNPWLAAREAAGNAATFLAPGGALKLGANAARGAKALTAARMIDNPLTQAAVAGIPSLQEIGDSQRESGQGENLGLKYLGAGLVGGIENLGGAQRVLGFGGQNASRSIAQQVAEFGKTPWRTVGKTVLRQGLEEGAEELAQTPIEQMAGYKNPLDSRSIDETVLGGAMGAIGGALFGGGIGAQRGLHHAKVNNYRQQDLLNPGTSLDTLNNQAEWNREFIARDHGQSAGDLFYNGQQATIDNYIESLVEPARRRQFALDMEAIQARADQERIAARAPSFLDQTGEFDPLADASKNAFERQQSGIGDQQQARDFWGAQQYDFQGIPQTQGALTAQFGHTPDMFGGEPNIGYGAPVETNNPRLVSEIGQGVLFDQQGAPLAPTAAQRVIDANLVRTQTRSQPATPNTARDFSAAYNAPSGVRVADPFNGNVERELTMGELQAIRIGDQQSVMDAWSLEAQRSKGASARVTQPQQVAQKAPQTPVAQAGAQQTAAPAEQAVVQADKSPLVRFGEKYGVKKANKELVRFVEELDTALTTGQISQEEHDEFSAALANAWSQKTKGARAAHNKLAAGYTKLLEERAKPADVHKVAAATSEDEANNFVNNLMGELTPEQRRVLELYHFDKQTFEDIGDTLANESGRETPYTRQRIEQLHSEAVGHIKRAAAKLGVPGERIDAYFGSENNSLQGGADVETQSAAAVAQSGASMHTPGEQNHQVDAEDADPAEVDGALSLAGDDENFDRDTSNDDVVGEQDASYRDVYDEYAGWSLSETPDGEEITRQDIDAATRDWDDRDGSTLDSHLLPAWVNLYLLNDRGVITPRQFGEHYAKLSIDNQIVQQESVDAGKANGLPANAGAAKNSGVPEAGGKRSSARSGAGGNESRTEERQGEPVADEATGRGDTQAEDQSAARDDSSTESAQTAELTPARIEAEWNRAASALNLPPFSGLTDEQQDYLNGSADMAEFNEAANEVAAEVSAELAGVEAQPSVNANNENPDVKYNLHTQLTKTDFKSAQEAAQWLAKNASNPVFRLVADKISSALGNTTLFFPNSLDESKDYARGSFSRGGIGVAARYPDGRVEVSIAAWKQSATTEENLLHELVHAATLGRLIAGGSAAQGFAKLAKTIKRELSSWNGTYPINDQRQKDIAAFFKSDAIFGDPAEFVAYAFSSPSFQEVMALMAADGQWYKSFRSQDEIKALNKNAGFTKQRAVPIPQYTAWQKFVDMVRSLFGLPKVYHNQIAALVAQNNAIDENNRKASTVAYRTLKEKVDSLLDQLLQENDAAQTQAAGTIKHNVEAATDRDVPATGLSGHNGPGKLTGAFAKVGNAVDEILAGRTGGLKELQLGWLTLDQIVDGAKRFGEAAQKALVAYRDTMDRMQRTSKDIVYRASLIDQKWNDLSKDAADRLSMLMQDSTLASYDPSTQEPSNDKQREIKARYEALVARGKEGATASEIYKESRDFFEGLWDKRSALLQDAAVKAKLNGEDLANIRAMYAKRSGPYFPLVRIGKYYAVGMTPRVAELADKKREGSATAAELAELDRLRKDGKSYISESFGSEREAYDAAKRYQATYGHGYSNLQEAKLNMAAVQLPGFAQLESYLAESIKDEGVRAELRDTFAQMIFDMSEEHSALKRAMKREGIAGANKDMRQAIAATAQAQAHYIGRLENSTTLSSDLFAIKQLAGRGNQDVKRVYNELVERTKLAYNMDKDNKWVDHLTSLSYMGHLGISPAFWLTNMTQVPMITAPWLGARYGFGKVPGALAAAFVDAKAIIKSSIVDGNWKNELDWSSRFAAGSNEDRLFRTLLDKGLLDVTLEHDLGAVARTGNPTGSTAAKFEQFKKLANTPVRVTEYANRAITALATYRLEMAKSGNYDQAVNAAAKALWQTQLNYNALNAPRYMRSVFGSKQLARIVMQFRKYQQGMLWLVSSNIKDALGGSKDEKEVARRFLAGLFTTTGVMAGSLGLPLMGSVGLLANIIGSLFGDADDPFDFENEVRNFYHDIAGKELGDIAAKGVLMSIGIDLSKRVGMADLANPIPFARAGNNGRETVGNVLSAVAGAPLGTVADTVDGVVALAKGEPLKAIEKAAPLKLAHDMARAVRYGTEGLTDTKGNVVLPEDQFSPWDLALRAAGFAPEKETTYFEANAAVQEAKYAAKDVREKLLRDFAKAQTNGDDLTKLNERIADFNTRHPEKGVRIDASAKLKSVQNLRRMAAERNDAGLRTDRGTKPFLSRAAFSED